MTVRSAVPACLAAAWLALVSQPATAQGGRSDLWPLFSVDQVLSAPFVSGLVASPDGRRIAWIADVAGRRNLYVAEAPRWAARSLTTHRSDDGRELTQPVWTPDGRGLLYVRGGDRSAAGEYPNPTSDPRGVAQEVWFVGLTGAARRIGEGTGPTPSPAGDRVAFVLRDTIWSASLRTAGPARVLFRARGRNGSPTWSPDGRLLAFVSRRPTHAFIGVYDLRRDTIRYLAAGVDRDALPRWSPDGARVAFVRQPGATFPGGAAPSSAPRQLPPWAIWVADVATGEGREVWHAPLAPDAAFPSLAGEWALAWGSGDRLVFAAEFGGWLGLYGVGVQGGDAVRLTPQGCEVEEAVLERERRSVLYTSNCGDSERRHIGRVAVAGGAPEAVTSGPTIEWSPQPLADGGAAFIRSDARRPGAPFVLAAAGGQPVRVAGTEPPASFPAEALVEPQFATVRTSDSVDVRMQLFLPPNAAAGRHPAVIFFHGGPRRQMLVGWHYRHYYHNAYAFNQYLASRGFVVLSVNYRTGIGYGRAFRMAARAGLNGASEYSDVLAAAAWLRARPDVDSARVGLWGGSYGGFLTALGLARNSDLFAAGFDLHGVHDWSVDRALPVGVSGGAVADSVLARWRASSPVADLARWRSPVLLVQGDDDRNVSFAQTVDLTQRLRRQGVVVELLVFPDEVHDFLRHAHWLQAYRAGAAFLGAKLGVAGMAAPSATPSGAAGPPAGGAPAPRRR
jgi:dipeptidyl aminopeptidase/acylaminoacyl peptidase